MAGPTGTTVVKRATAMPDSDQAENNRLTALAARGWVISAAAGGLNATQVSISAFAALVQGGMLLVAASGGTAIFASTPGTIAASTTGAYVVTVAAVSSSGTLKGYLMTGASLGALVMPTTVGAGELPVFTVLVACTATAFNGGTNSFADSSYTVSLQNITGPTALALSTENWTNVPG